MRGFYEQQWQEAMTGASIHPSEGLWENIAARLDSERGRSGWVTLLMIAATITVAFAFPLTIGNSSFEGRPDAHQYISRADGNALNSDGTSTHNSGQIEEQPGPNKNPDEKGLLESASDSRISRDTPTLVARSTEKADPVTTNVDNKQNLKLSNKEILALKPVSTQAIGLPSFDLNYTTPLADFNNYYFIPFYVPSNSITERSLLASLNMGTGSLSAGSGFNGVGLFSADEAKSASALSEASDVAVISDQRVEDSGSTFYFGVGVELPIGRRWSFLAGLGYLAQNASGTSNIVFDNGNVYQPLGTYDPIVPGTVFLSESYSYSVTNSYINVPLTLKYPFVNRKIKLRGGIGLSTDFMVAHTVNSDSYGKANYNPTSMAYKRVVLAGLFNLDLSYSLNNQYSVALETGVRKGFTPIDEGKDYYPSSFTIGLILFYKIR